MDSMEAMQHHNPQGGPDFDDFDDDDDDDDDDFEHESR